MAIRVSFEIGHEASIRAKRTPEGFTHDWEVFVRGVDGANISHFVDKVVFMLHDSFLKPKRVVKEPPYTVKESGYAGFNLPIDIYLKNRDEPKKIKFNYDLILHEFGLPIVKVQKEKYVFQNPTDEFKKKLLKGGGIVSNSNPFLQHLHLEHERDSRDSYTDDKPTQLIGKSKLSSENMKKHKSKDYRSDDLPRPTNSFENLFGPPIHKSSKISPDPKKASPNPKLDKKDKEKLLIEKDKQKARTEVNKDKDYKEDKMKSGKEEKDRIKEEKRSKGYKDLDRSKEKNTKRPDRPISPTSEASVKRSPKRTQSPKRSVSPMVMKSNGSVSSKEDKSRKLEAPEVKKMKPVDPDDVNKSEKKQKKDKKNYDRDKSKDNKREHRKESESKGNNNVNDVKETKVKEVIKVKESTPKDFSVHKDKERTPVKPEKVFNKFSIENMLKDPQEASSKHVDSSKHRSPGEKKHKHKKKDKKHDESKEKHKEEKHKEKKHKHDKYKEKLLDVKEAVIVEKSETVPIEKNVFSKVPKEKDRSIMVVSPASTENNLQTNFKNAVKSMPKSNKNTLGSMIDALSSSSNNSEAEMSISDDDASNTVSKSIPKTVEITKQDLPKNLYDNKAEKLVEKVEKNNCIPIQKEKNSKKKDKDKDASGESKEEKRQKKRKGSKRDSPDAPSKQTKLNDEVDLIKSNKGDVSNGSQTSDSSLRIKSDAKSQDSSMSSGAGDENTSKCESPDDSEDTSQGTTDLREMTPDYMMQLKDLQHRIMTIQSNDELERVVNLIAETGKYEVTKKTFDFDLCLLDRSTVQQLQELIGCESRA